METADSLATSLSLLSALFDGTRRDPAWAEFVARYGPLIRAWCAGHRLQPADADEIEAAVLYRLIDGLKTYRRGTADAVRHFRPWLRTVVENAVRDHYRRCKRRPGDRAAGDALDQLAGLEARVGGACDLDVLLQQISDHLDADYAQVFRAVRERRQGTRSWRAFEMLCLQEREVAEVAAALDMTPAAVSTAAYRVKAELNAAYERRARAAPEDHDP